ncbi:AAA family ATPase [Marinobacter salicampi]|uniref:AAA family ATPase n=1 Tax=Marinobacter salicampi TaxID=435907 RepID=UPI0014072895|nr:AAA family ATPase [Marinobacter salicampi]
MTDSKPVSRQPRILAITGGKGGVGKTSVALNLALTLAREGSRVLLLDGDTDLANISIMLGQYPDRTLADFLDKRCSLTDTLMSAPFGLDIIPGASGVQKCMDMAEADSFELLRSLAELERHYEYVLIDTAAGLQPVVLHMIAAAGMACVVVTPDPTALTDAFSLLKVLQRRGYRRTPSVLVNMAQGASQARSVFQRFAGALQRHLSIQPHYLGAIWRDETLRQSIINQRPVALMPESDPSSRQFRVLADMVKVRLDQLPPRKAGIAAYWHQIAKKGRVAESSRDGHEGNIHGRVAAPAAADTDAKPAGVAEAPEDRAGRLVAELGALLKDDDGHGMLRYEAFMAWFALLGRTMDEDTIEIVQTGLASLDWNSLAPGHRQHLATHLRHLADQMAPAKAPETSELAGFKTLEPRYDQVIFGDQDRLLKAMREQPVDVSLDRFLRSLTERSG